MQYPVTIKQKDGTEKTFWLSDEKLQFGGTDSGVTDVKINGTSIVDGGVANVPVAVSDSGEYGMVKIKASNGIQVNADGLGVVLANNANIDGRNSSMRPIVPTNLDYAVKAALTDARKIAYTDAEKASARATIGAVAVSEIPYATASTAGVVKPQGSAYGIAYSGQTGVITTASATDVEIAAKTNNYKPIVPANLDTAVKASLSHSTVEWTDAETAAARDVLGVGIADNSDKNGLVHGGSYGVIVNSTTGMMSVQAASNSEVDARTNNYHPVTPSSLNYAVKAALTDANKMTMTAAEQASARETLGLEEMMANDSDLKLVKTITLQGNETSFTETGFKYKKVAIYFENVVPSDTTSNHLLRATCLGSNNATLGGIYHDNWKSQPYVMTILKKEDGLWRGVKMACTGSGGYNQGLSGNTLTQIFDTSAKEYVEKIEFSFDVTPVAGGKIKIYASEHDDSVIAPMTKRKIYDQTLTSAATGNIDVPLTGNPKKLQIVTTIPASESASQFRIALIVDDVQKTSGNVGAWSTTGPTTIVAELERVNEDGVYLLKYDTEWKVWASYPGKLTKLRYLSNSASTVPLPAGTRVVVYEIGEQAVPSDSHEWRYVEVTTDANTPQTIKSEILPYQFNEAYIVVSAKQLTGYTNTTGYVNFIDANGNRSNTAGGFEAIGNIANVSRDTFTMFHVLLEGRIAEVDMVYDRTTESTDGTMSGRTQIISNPSTWRGIAISRSSASAWMPGSKILIQYR